MAAAILFWTGSALALLFLLLLLAVTAHVILLQYRIWRYRHLPSPKMLPQWSSYLFGHGNQLRKLMTGEATLNDYIQPWVSDLGPVFVLHFHNFPRVICASKEAVKEFVASGNHFKNPTSYDNIGYVLSERFLGHGLVVEHRDPIWEPKRRLFNPAFHRSYLRLSMDQFNHSTDDLIRLLTPRADGETPVKMMEEVTGLALDVIGKVGFGYDCKSLTGKHSEFQEAFTIVLRAQTKTALSPWMQYSIHPETIAERKKIKACVRYLRKVGEEVISERIGGLKSGEDARNDILSYILTATEKEGRLEMDELVDEFLTFFLAGNETSANTISALLLHLSQNPDVERRLQEEVEQVLGKRIFIEFEDLPKLEYMTAVIKETLRISGPVDATVRKTSFDVEVNGLCIPKDTVVIITGTHHRVEYFPDPVDFKPERFLNGSIEPHTYLPFSVGPRACIGQQFAMMEMKVILAKLFQTFHLTWVPGQSYDFIMGTTAKPKDGALHFLTLKSQNRE